MLLVIISPWWNNFAQANISINNGYMSTKYTNLVNEIIAPIDFPYSYNKTIAILNLRQDDKLKTLFKQKHLTFPPQKVLFYAVKSESILETWVFEKKRWHLLKTYPILKKSGSSGPKRFEGDLQIPEGIYKITWLNHQSNYHLSMQINYPNKFDRKWARFEKRASYLGGNIFIHGKNRSSGCLAMGDMAIEELFYLGAAMKKLDIKIIITPFDPRKGKIYIKPNTPQWVKLLYQKIIKATNKITI